MSYIIIKILKIITRNVEFILKGKELSFIDQISLKLETQFKTGSVNFDGKKIYYTHAPSFVGMYEEMFIHHVYKFPSSINDPVIIDCGANIGLSVIYFKKLFPYAEIIAFEPDDVIFELLEKNIQAFNLSNVTLHKKAVWNENAQLSFVQHKGLSGHIAAEEDKDNDILKVEALRLKDILNQKKIDFLKLDIEGAEYEVLVDCASELKNVQNLFVEYHSNYKSEQKLDEILHVIRSAGFRIQIKEVYTSALPYVEIQSRLGMDLQLNILGYR